MQYYAPLTITRSQTEDGQYVIEEDQLKVFVNSAEWNLGESNGLTSSCTALQLSHDNLRSTPCTKSRHSIGRVERPGAALHTVHSCKRQYFSARAERGRYVMTPLLPLRIYLGSC